MEWNIPSIVGDSLQISLEADGRLFVVGANGSGKSALLQYLISSKPRARIKRISAHRQTWLDSGSIDFTPQHRKQFEQDRAEWDRRLDSRWMEHAASQRQSAVLFDLVSKENSRARSITHFIDEKDSARAIELASESTSTFNQLNELLALGTLTVSLKNSNDEEILAQHGKDRASFSIAQMSDGERNAAIIAATVLTVETETILLIDEPERHLHRAIIEPFLSALFERRRDCAFIVSTHEIALPVASPEADVLMVRSCAWTGNQASAWDAEILAANTNLPQELKLAILGARRRILFVEGTTKSLDLPLYHALFPGLSVIPKGSCNGVLKAMSGLRGSYDHHHVEAVGLIDRDSRTECDIEALAADGVFALDVHSAEALYYCSDSVAAVARRQAESLGCDAETMIESVKQNALDLLRQDGLAERMAARRCEGQMRNRILSQAPDWKLIKANADPKITVCVDSPYPEELNRFRELVDEGDLDGLVARYPLRESGVFGAIAGALKCSDPRDYERMVVSRVRGESELARLLRKRIGPLSEALDAKSAGSENNAS